MAHDNKLMSYLRNGTIKEIITSGSKAAFIIQRGDDEFVFEVNLHWYDDKANLMYGLNKRITTLKSLYIGSERE
jgi:hypothetical protein